MRARLGISLLVAGLFSASAAGAEEYNGARVQPSPERRAAPIQRLIVKWRMSASPAVRKPSAVEAAAHELARFGGVRLEPLREMAPGLELLELEWPLAPGEAAETLERLRADPAIDFVEPDELRRPHAVPSDSLFPNQWYLQDVQPAGTRANLAWDVTTGSVTTVVAVLDTGVRFDHPDLGRTSASGKLLPGYDFVSADSGGSFLIANDGNGRDSDPSDPGDWIDSADLQQPTFSGGGCQLADSSWHGTRVSGIIGALSDNGIGIAGMAWRAQVLPVRVLGKCGGFDSDIIPAMRWAAGLPVGGVPSNPTPANVINLSLGSDGPCRQTYVSALQELAAAGVLVVASAGNDGGPVDSPGNCPGVFAVGALRHVGTKVGFSNVGPGVAISAPGGNCVNTAPGSPCLFSIDTTVDVGTTVPAGSAYTDQFNISVGTSFSAPIVAGVVALMEAVNPALSVAQITTRLRESARPFPTPATPPQGGTCRVPANENDVQLAECRCTTQTCGAGMVDANGAVASASRPLASIVSPGPVVPGQAVTLNGSASFASLNRTIATYAWTVVSAGGSPPVITNPDQSVASITAPTSGNLTLRLTVTDDQGAQDSADLTIAGPPAPMPNPGGGGGGGMGLELLLLAAMLAAWCTLSRHGNVRYSKAPIVGKFELLGAEESPFAE